MRRPALRSLFELATRNSMPVPTASREKHHFRLGYEKSGLKATFFYVEVKTEMVWFLETDSHEIQDTLQRTSLPHGGSK